MAVRDLIALSILEMRANQDGHLLAARPHTFDECVKARVNLGR